MEFHYIICGRLESILCDFSLSPPASLFVAVQQCLGLSSCDDKFAVKINDIANEKLVQGRV